jgi:hypothetical protein
MKPDHARARANSALPALADASSIAAVAQNDLSLPTELLNVQPKLPLLTTEHLVLSHGFYMTTRHMGDIKQSIAEHFFEYWDLGCN